MLGVTGLNHKKAPVEVREQLVLTSAEVTAFLGVLKADKNVSEAVVLSTCNRTEIYYCTADGCRSKNSRAVVEALIGFKNTDSSVSEYFYFHEADSAVFHLFKVSSGLDSMVLGENQILGQVKEAYRLGTMAGSTGVVLNKLFHKAFEAGKKVRTNTDINKGASSVGYAAVELALKLFESLENRMVFLIGAGETGQLVIKSLAGRGAKRIFVANRTAKRIHDLVCEYKAQAVDYNKKTDFIKECDIVITATRANEYLITTQEIRKIMKVRKNRVLFVIDLSVPRNVDERINSIDAVYLYNIDHLQEVVAYNYEKRKGEIKKAYAIVDTHCKEFKSWLSSLNLTPTIVRLKKKIYGIGEKELKEYKKELSSQEFERMNDLSCSIRKRFVGLVVKHLREMTKNGQSPEYIDVVNKLFGLRED